jgi:hypothetical protein
VLGASGSEADPHGRCPAGVGGCGNDGSGLCVSGACLQVPVGTMCGASFSCPSPTVFQPAGGCTSGGTCSTPGPQNCSPFVCATGGCLGVCASDAQCAAGNYCNSAGSCVAKQGTGASCTGDNQCAGGTFCTDGVCCGANDCGACNTCNGAIPGTCTAFSNGSADSRCPTDSAPSCGTNGLCESGACQRYGMGTQCDTSCDLLLTTLTRTYCDGMGHCDQPQAESCGLLQCTLGGCI